VVFIVLGYGFLNTRGPDGGENLIEGSSLPALDWQAKGSEYSFASKPPGPERKSSVKRRAFRKQDSSSGPGVFTLKLLVKIELFTIKIFRGAKLFTAGCGGVLEGSPRHR
jgi:hypothetical protein